MRELRYRVIASLWRERITAVLAMGELGVEFYERVGFPRGKIHEFAYYVPEIVTSNTRKNDVFSFLYVGKLVARKNVRLLISALSNLRHEKWHCTIVGAGPESIDIRNDINLSGLHHRFDQIESLPNDRVVRLMGQADCLVLPSRFDGWGAVINESLSCGTPVIASRKCGGSCLLKSPDRGGVFCSGDEQELVRLLSRAIHAGRVTPARRQRICNWAKEAISVSSGATYLNALIRQSPAAQPPWKVNESDQIKN